MMPIKHVRNQTTRSWYFRLHVEPGRTSLPFVLAETWWALVHQSSRQPWFYVYVIQSNLPFLAIVCFMTIPCLSAMSRDYKALSSNLFHCLLQAEQTAITRRQSLCSLCGRRPIPSKHNSMMHAYVQICSTSPPLICELLAIYGSYSLPRWVCLLTIYD